jgi:site-specific recombinase XerD
MSALLSLRENSPCNQDGDWVFASITAKGRVPFWPSSWLADHIQPAVKAAGASKHVSWHVFRHSYATLLKANGADAKVVQESLRHASSRISMDVYTQAVPEHVRSAHGKVVESIALQIPLRKLAESV